MKLKLGILASHPIQYQAPLFRELARRCDLQVFFAYRITPQAQADAGFGVAFEWDIDLFSGYKHTFLTNNSKQPSTSSFSGCDTPEIANKIKLGGFNAFLVMGWNLKSYWQAITACHRYFVPVMVRGDSQLVTPRGKFKQWFKSLFYPIMLRQFNACLYVGQRNREYLEHYGVPADRLFFAPHCVDTQMFAAAAKQDNRDTTRAAWKLEPNDRVVLFAGKLVNRKRPSDLVKGVAQMRANGQSAVLVWAGDGPERRALETLGDILGVPMKFLGFCNQSQLPSVYRAADVLVLPSDGSETWGLVVNEAMSCGTPCVVSDACGCAPDMIEHHVNGAVFNFGSIDSLASNLQTALQIERDSVGIFKHSEKYSVEMTANGILSAISSLKK